MLTVKEEIIDKLTEAIYKMHTGKEIHQVDLPDTYPDDEVRQLTDYLNKFIVDFNKITEIMALLAVGNVNVNPGRCKMQLIQNYKQVKSNFRHLGLKTQQIANGDFEQRINFLGDFSLAFNSMTEQLQAAFEKIGSQNQELIEANKIISMERSKSEKLLLNILPEKVASDLKATGKTEPEVFENVSVFFSDIVGFTKLSSTIHPSKLIAELTEMFTVFDEIMERNGCERIKTIGDAYLAVCGMHQNSNKHACQIVNSAIEIREYMAQKETSDLNWQIRIGIHTGSVVGGVVGTKKFIYDVFGDTINTASRMESNSEPMKINLSEDTYNLVKDKYNFIKREPLHVKGKGSMNMYFLE